MLKARKLGVHTPGAGSVGHFAQRGVAHRMPGPAQSPPAIITRLLVHPCRPPTCATAVLYHVDHATAAIYMERVAGHSLKTLLQQRALQGAGARRRRALLHCCRAACRPLMHADQNACLPLPPRTPPACFASRAGGAAAGGGAHHCARARRRPGARRPHHLQHDAAGRRQAAGALGLVAGRGGRREVGAAMAASMRCSARVPPAHASRGWKLCIRAEDEPRVCPYHLMSTDDQSTLESR